jgi:glycosyltransferase involved in cell wall biosynthesis
VFVIDGSPDESRARLVHALESAPFRALVVDHSRNFGAFVAIRTGLSFGTAEYLGVMAADLQEPPDLMLSFVEILQTTDAQVVVGERASRPGDRRRDRIASGVFWRFYRRFVIPEIPPGGVDVFACSAEVRDHLLQFGEAHSSLIGLLFWLGYPRATVPYERLPRADEGKGAWTLRKRYSYMMDSIFAFTDLPLRLLRSIGLIGLTLALVSSLVVLVAWWQGGISVPGYTPLILSIFVATMLMLSALGIVGSYVWRTYENTKRRPLSVVRAVETLEP